MQESTFFTKKIQNRTYGDFEGDFFTKIEKTKKCETLTHGDFDNIFEKKKNGK